MASVGTQTGYYETGDADGVKTGPGWYPPDAQVWALPAGWASVNSTRTLQYAIVNTTRVSSTRTVQYAIFVTFTRVATTRNLAYAISSRTSSTRQLRYQILLAPYRISSTKTLQYNIADATLTETEPAGRFLLAFDAPSLEYSPVWTRIDSYPNLVTSYTIDRGRQYELDRTDTGRATVTITDKDGILDPTNPDGPFFLQIQPLTQARLGRQNPVTGEWNTRFRGWVEDLTYSFDPSQQVNRLQVSLVDMFEILANIEMQPGKFGTPPRETGSGQITWTGQFMDDRIIMALDQSNVPKKFRVVFTGNVTLQIVTYSAGESPLAVIQDSADGEFPGVANVFCDRRGRLCVHGRLSKFFPDEVAAGASIGAWDFQRWKAGDGHAVQASITDTAQLRSFGFNRGLAKIINQATATPQGIADDQVTYQLVEDPISIGKYGIRSWSATNLLTEYSLLDGSNAKAETKRFATYYVQNFAQPHNRIQDVSFRTLRPDDPRAPALYAMLGEIDIADAVGLTVGSPGGGGFVDAQYFVEGIHESVQPLNAGYDDVTLSLDLSPAALYASNPWPDS